MTTPGANDIFVPATADDPGEDGQPQGKVAPSDQDFPWVCFNKHSYITHASAGAGKLLKVRSLVGKAFSELIYPEDAALFVSHLRRCRETPGLSIISKPRLLVRKLPLRVELRSVSDIADGKLKIHTALITEKRPRQKFSDVELLEGLFDNLHGPAFVLDSNLRILIANRSFNRLLNLKSSEAAGSRFFKLPGVVFHPLRMEQRLHQVLLTGTPLLSYTMGCDLMQVGRRFTFLLNARRFSLSAEEKPFLAVHLHDATRWKEADRQRETLLHELKKLSETLEQRITARTTALGQANQRLQGLSSELLQAHEAERRHLAIELHDQVGQSLTALKLSLDSIAPAVTGLQAADLKKAQQILSEVMGLVRRLSANLRPQILDDLGLRAAIDWHAAQFRELAKIRLSVRFINFDEKLLSPTETITTFRIFQEALNNVTKHANASSVQAKFGLHKSKLELRVRDNGKGFKPERIRPSASGLSGMKERLQLLGGELTVKSLPGQGTTLIARLPLKKA